MTEAERQARYQAALHYRLTDACVETLLENLAPTPEELACHPDAAAERKRAADRERKRAKMHAAGATPRNLAKGYK